MMASIIHPRAVIASGAKRPGAAPRSQEAVPLDRLVPLAKTGAISRKPYAMPLRTAALAATLLCAGPTRALDLEKAIPTLEPCPSKGQGFFRVPGSRSCTRLTGRVVAGADLRAGRAAVEPPAALTPPFAGHVAIDNRADSDLGEVRTYVRIGNGRR